MILVTSTGRQVFDLPDEAAAYAECRATQEVLRYWGPPEDAPAELLEHDPDTEARAEAEAALLAEVRGANRLNVVAELVERVRALAPK